MSLAFLRMAQTNRKARKGRAKNYKILVAGSLVRFATSIDEVVLW
jgi:hypothetical protein